MIHQNDKQGHLAPLRQGLRLYLLIAFSTFNHLVNQFTRMTLRFFRPLGIGLVALASFAACSQRTPAVADNTAPLRPSEHITTLEDSTQVVNTTKLAADVIGYSGVTPLEIHIKGGRITEIVLLQDQHGETNSFYVDAADNLDWTAFEGKLLREAANAHVDAVSGATLTSNALLENIRLGLAHAIAQQDTLHANR